MAKLKIYGGIVRKGGESHWAYACSTSKEKAAVLIADVIGGNPAHIQSSLSIKDLPESLEEKGLAHGEVSIRPTKPKFSKSRTLRENDLNMIGDISIINSAEKMLQSCTIQNPELKARLSQIREELTEIKIDLKEDIRNRYSAYTRDVQ